MKKNKKKKTLPQHKIGITEFTHASTAGPHDLTGWTDSYTIMSISNPGKKKTHPHTSICHPDILHVRAYLFTYITS